jgi:succinate--hydroxymethylglutarate CoA-transferase
VPYKGFKTKDGDILVGGGNDKLFSILCQKLGKPEWISDSRFKTNNVRVQNRVELESLIEQETTKQTTEEWLELLEGCGMPYAAINDIQTTLNHTHSQFGFAVSIASTDDRLARAREMVKEIEHPSCGPMNLVNTPVKFSHAKPSIRMPPPTLGQHTDEILKEVLGYSSADIESLKSEGVIA